MRRFFQVIALVVAASTITASAQLKVFNHLGADLSVGTTGIGIELSTPITSYVQMRAGLSIMPGVNFNSNFDGTVEVNAQDNLGNSITQKEPFDMDLNAGLKRTQGDIIYNVYPFGKLNSFFVAAGAYFGGRSIVTLDGHSDKVAM